MKPSLLIIGLGNPGKEYEHTRHNAGFWALDLLEEKLGTDPWQEKQKFRSTLCEARCLTAPLLLIKPQTYMNDSGDAVRRLLSFYQLDPAKQCMVLCDDIDLPVGKLRMTETGGAGSHNGLKSIQSHIGETYPRIRIGIRGPRAPQGSFQKAGEDLAQYVLSAPEAEERRQIEGALEDIPDLIKKFVLGE